MKPNLRALISFMDTTTSDVDQKPIYLIVGLGNPGREHRDNRHNIGFMLVTLLAERLDVAFSRLESKALVAKADHQGARLILAKPQTYMNLSGQAVSALTRFYKIPFDKILAVYDDVDLPLGALRLRPGGGSGGHKGMASIIERLGGQDIPRMRIGIDRPPGRMDASAYVLRNFSPAEIEFLHPALERASDAALSFITEGLEATMNQYNRSG